MEEVGKGKQVEQEEEGRKIIRRCKSRNRKRRRMRVMIMEGNEKYG